MRTTDYRTDDRVTVSDRDSIHFELTGTVCRVHTINGEIFYDVDLPHRNGIGSDSWLLRSRQIYNAS